MSHPLSPAGRGTRLEQLLDDLLRSTPEIESAAVVSYDGLPMASAMPGTMDTDRVAAMSAALLSLGERAAEGLGRGLLSQVFVEGEHGTVCLVAAGDEGVLVGVAPREAKIGLVLFELKSTAAAIASVLQEPMIPSPSAALADAAAMAAAVAPMSAAPAAAQASWG